MIVGYSLLRQHVRSHPSNWPTSGLDYQRVKPHQGFKYLHRQAGGSSQLSVGSRAMTLFARRPYLVRKQAKRASTSAPRPTIADLRKKPSNTCLLTHD